MISPASSDLKPGQGVINYSTREGVARRQFGVKLARRKLLDSAKNLQQEHEKNGTIWIDMDSSMPPLLFHRMERSDDEANRSDENALQGNIPPLLVGGSSPIYRNVAFLNDEVVIASTTNGLIDAVRLPDGFDIKADGSEFQGSHVEIKRKRRGKLIADQLGNPVQGSVNTSIKLRSLSNGQSFVAGLPSGYLQIFSTERESTWCRQRFKQQQISEMKYNHEKGDETFIRMILQIAPPRRRYLRDCTHAKLSLQGLITSWTSGKLSEQYGLSEIPDWDLNSSPLHHTGNSEDFNESSWDFRKSGSTLLSAHIHPQKDCFSIHTIDENVRYAKDLNNSSSATCLGDTKPLICLDTTSWYNCCKCMRI